jgi:hypothetical protein
MDLALAREARHARTQLSETAARNTGGVALLVTTAELAATLASEPAAVEETHLRLLPCQQMALAVRREERLVLARLLVTAAPSTGGVVLRRGTVVRAATAASANVIRRLAQSSTINGKTTRPRSI